MFRSFSVPTRRSNRGRAVVTASAFLASAFLAMALIGGLSSSKFSAVYAQTAEPVQQVVIPLNKSVTVAVAKPFTSAVVGQPEIADTMPINDRTLYIQGKKIGTTNISIYDESMRLIKVVDVEVALDVRNLQSKIRAGTGNNGIIVSSDNGQLVLSGVANDAVTADRAFNLARTWASNLGNGGTVVNAINIASPQEVMLKVRFLEVDRNAGRELGINWSAVNNNNTSGINTGLGTLTTSTPPNPNSIGVFQAVGSLVGSGVGAPFGTILAQVVNKGVQIDAMITALETKGLVQTLAEPNLVALSGDSANFQAGGSIPVPTAVTSGLGVASPTITFEPFGVLLNFRPTVLANGIINVSINPSVSALDFSNEVSISGTTIPALTVRSATTTIELRDGQSFAIAGLLQADNNRTISQLPWVGSIPVLGALFRSAAYQKSETDLVIIVTPSLVQPAPPGARLATPFDNTVPSNDVDFFLMGQTEERKKYTDYVATGGNLQGPYGYMLGVMQGSDNSNVQK
jgi:pilus assembly protein CpaC